MVRVLEITAPGIEPSARAVDEAGLIQVLHDLGDTRGVVLPPAFVEDDPDDDGGDVVMLLDHFGELQFMLVGKLLGLGHAVMARIGILARGAARHVLPDKQSELVGPIVPSCRLDLDVLAGHVESELLGHLDVELQRLVGRRRVDAVGPIPLVERSRHVDRLVVEHRPENPLFVLSLRDFTHPGIAFHRVASECDGKVVEERRVGGPER